MSEPQRRYPLLSALTIHESHDVDLPVCKRPSKRPSIDARVSFVGAFPRHSCHRDLPLSLGQVSGFTRIRGETEVNERRKAYTRETLDCERIRHYSFFAAFERW